MYFTSLIQFLEKVVFSQCNNRSSRTVLYYVRVFFFVGKFISKIMDLHILYKSNNHYASKLSMFGFITPSMVYKGHAVVLIACYKSEVMWAKEQNSKGHTSLKSGLCCNGNTVTEVTKVTAL